jgi:hypothetical protein
MRSIIRHLLIFFFFFLIWVESIHKIQLRTIPLLIQVTCCYCIMTDSVIPNILASAAAGILSRCLTHPLDTAKSRLQAIGHQHVYTGPFDVLRKTYRAEGVQGLYRGFGAVIVGGTPGTIIYLCSYDIFKDKISKCSQDDGFPNQDEGESFIVHSASGLLAEGKHLNVPPFL